MPYFYVPPKTKKCFSNETSDSEIIETILYRIPSKNLTISVVASSISFVISLFTTIITHIMNAALWSEMISYILLSGIKLYAVSKPLHYRNTFTIKRCIYLSSFSWIVFIVLLSSEIIMYVVCGTTKCGSIIYDQIQNATSTGIYCFTIIFFTLTAIFVYRAKKFPDGRSKKSKFPFSTFAIVFGVFIFFYSFIIANDIFRSYIVPNTSFCFQLLELRGVPATAIRESIWILFLIRIFIDPFINCFFDKKIKDSMKSVFPSLCFLHKCQKRSGKIIKPSAQISLNDAKDAFHLPPC